MSDENNTAAGAAPSKGVDTGELEVTLTFELERRLMTVRDVETLAPGYTFAFGGDALAPQLVFALLKEDAFRQGNHGAGGRCPGIRTAEQTVFALLDQPYRPLFVIDGKQFRIEVQR